MDHRDFFDLLDLSFCELDCPKARRIMSWHGFCLFCQSVMFFYTKLWMCTLPIVSLSMGESSTIVSAYTMYRHLQQYCSLPSILVVLTFHVFTEQQNFGLDKIYLLLHRYSY